LGWADRACRWLDYDEAMKFWFRFAAVTSCVLSAWAQPALPDASPPASPALTPATSPAATPQAALSAAGSPLAPPISSALDAALFYQLLLGELNVQAGSAGSGFSMILDAARKTNDPQLFQRAVDVALRSRSGEAALQAAQAWKSAVPASTQANRYLLQILLALNRVDEAGKALATSIQDLPADEQNAAIASVPSVFSRVSDKKLAADTVEKALSFALKQANTAAAAWTTVGRMRREAGQAALSVAATRQGHSADPKAPGPLILALSLSGVAPAEMGPLLEKAMQTDVPPEIRLGYARLLIGQGQQAAAQMQLSQLNAKHPDFAAAWLVHGLFLLESGKRTEAEQKLRKHVDLAKSMTNPNEQTGLTEALMALAQLAQQKGQWALANEWLAQVPPDAEPTKLASRQADLLTQQGLLDEAWLVLSQIKTSNAEQATRKVLVQSLWLRENKRVDEAYALVNDALKAQPQNTDLMSELAMVCEKLKRYDEMETLLRQLMQRKPEDPHAFNALGYSLADRNTRLDEARQLITKALQLAPNDAYIQDSLGWVAYRQGRMAEALEVLQAAFKSRPDAEIAAHLGEVLWVLGERQQAATIWREGLMLKSDNSTLLETLQRFDFKP